MHDDNLLAAAAETLARATPRLDSDRLAAAVSGLIDRRQRYLDVRQCHGSPLYVFEPRVLAARAQQFKAAFETYLPGFSCFFAIKSNNCPQVAQTLIGSGFGLDVSSGRELDNALALGPERVVFSGPAKTIDELELAVCHAETVTVLMDSFGELSRLEAVAAGKGVRVKAGVRLTTDENGLWRKFGIPLTDLPRFIAEAGAAAHVELCGLQFHSSWNMNPDNQTAFIARLGRTLAGLDAGARRAIRFLDVGGGFWPTAGEWLQYEATPEGRLSDTIRPGERRPLDHRSFPAAPIDHFARCIAEALREHVFPYVECAVCAEPGRWVCHDAMSILLTVVDKKAEDLVITDGGGNAIGWERFESDYFPVVNLSRPSLTERACMILGSLCTPHDVWGYAYFGESVEPGDVLLIPSQGAYTYSLRQQFIKPIPNVVALD
ncbi:MAG TPA: decarboxylase [Candidatus Hydrogenedentes bacterium]|nr:decarboxylase [Candidatus Hydrogenedentota bacterium]